MIIINFISIPFSEMVKTLNEEIIDDMLKMFCCRREPFIETFIKEKIFSAEEMGSTKSYFILDEDRSDSNTLCAVGYYALSLKVLVINKGMSKKKVKALHLMDNEDHIPTYYIALLAKNDKYEKEIQGKEIINCAMSTIIEAVKCVGGRVVWVEAKNKNKKVVDFYINNGFKEFQQELQDDGEVYSHLLKIVKPK